jgi:membrane protein DedA with SNARE-associated domain
MMNTTTSSFGYLAGLFGVITLGAAVPFLPSGAPLSAGAALAAKDSALTVILVFVVGAGAAYVGDLLTYILLLAAARRTSESQSRLGRWANKERSSKAVKRAERAFEHRPIRTMMLSRLVPGGRTPVLITAALDNYAVAKYAAADVVAAAMWSAYYTGSGLAGRALFSNDWEAVGASLAFVLLVSLAGSLWSRSRQHRSNAVGGGQEQRAAPPTD